MDAPFLPDELPSSALVRGAGRAGLKLRAATLHALGQATALHPQFPRHLPKMMANMMISQENIMDVIWKHSCYPLIAPFIEEPARRRLFSWLKGDPGRLGLPRFSTVLFQTYKYCPECLKEQERKYGERYWQRKHQVPELSICPKHGSPLLDTSEAFRDDFGISRTIPPDDAHLLGARPLNRRAYDDVILQTLEDLFDAPRTWPTPAQWRRGYERLIEGRTLAEIDRAARKYWGSGWLFHTHQIVRATDLLRGRHRSAWWMHLTLLMALKPDMTMREMMDFALSN